MRTVLVALVCGAGMAGAAAAQELKVKPGNWETSTTMNMSIDMNGQAMTIPPRTMNQTECMKPEDAKFSTEDLIQEGCSVSNVKSSERSLSFDLTCSQQGANMNGTMSFEIDPSGDSGNGTMSLNGSMPGGTMEMSGVTTAKRLGDC